tara:strand:+ start:186 stop:455 length:270 start_codon:yes stop_codon:yes gene_type:complete
MNNPKPSPWWKNPHHFLMLVCILLIGYAFFGNAGSSWLTTLLFIACPLMHLMMMKGMGHNCEKGQEKIEAPQSSDVTKNEQPTGFNREF